jgi:hypothetical protein
MTEGIVGLIGGIPYRLALAGGWIDQPFVSERNPAPPGSMVVVAVEPEFRFMDLCGMATSTRKVADRLWGGRLPARPPDELVRELYAEENRGKAEPSGSQDMAGLVYPGVSRLDYDAAYEGGVFPARVESNVDPGIAAWIERVIRILPVAQRPAGYSPLGVKNLEPAWIQRLGESGRACFEAISGRDLGGLQTSMNECMRCWEAILPATVRHPAIAVDLPAIHARYAREYGGAMYSGCGGGYLFIATDRSVPGTFGIRVRLDRSGPTRAR